MMDYNMMTGNDGNGMMFFAWVTYILVIVTLVLANMALWKYVSKK